MKRTPSTPPHTASSVIWTRGASYPHRKRAGTVNINPEASEELAEPVVWEMLHSRIVGLPNSGVSILRIATETTASGIAVLIVSPTLRPR